MYKPFSFILFLFLTAVSCRNQTAQAPNTDLSRDNRQGSQTIQTAQTAQTPARTLAFQVIDAPNKTFGYEISVDGKKLIRQTSIPAVAGIEGFKTAAQAEKVAQFLIEKMKKNDALPAISLDELRQLDALQK
jgi:hypothetical protein